MTEAEKLAKANALLLEAQALILNVWSSTHDTEIFTKVRRAAHHTTDAIGALSRAQTGA